MPYRSKRWLSDSVCTALLLMFAIVLSSPAAYAAQHALTLQTVESLVKQALIKEQAGDDIEIDIIGKLPAVLARGNEQLSASLDFIDYDARSLRWEATISIFEGETLVRNESLSGRYAPMIAVPVLTRRLHSKEMIEASDIAFELFPEHRLRKDTVMNMETLVGKSPRRIISENRPIRDTDIQAPRVVSKGELVHVSYATAFMEIRTIGEAMDDAALGERVRVRNTESDIVIHAVITAPGQAEVKQLMQLSSAR